MVRKLMLLAALMLLVLPVTAQEAPPKVNIKEVEISGVTTNADGKPVADATIAEMWSFSAGAWKASGGTKSDADGKFALKVRTFPDQKTRAYRIQAIDAESKLGAVSVVRAEGLASPFNFKLEPLVEVSAKLLDPEGAKVPDSFYANIYWANPQTHICGSIFASKAFSFNLPVGGYSYMISAADCKFARKTFKVEAGKEKLDVGPIQLELTPIALMYGKEAAPIAVSYVRNLPADLEKKGAQVQLGDFKGRWVLLEYWGWW
jgi:hypothetical protein